MLTLDTSGVVAAADRRDRSHAAVRRVLDDEPGSMVIPVEILAETTYMLEARLGSSVVREFVGSLLVDEPVVDRGTELGRIAALIEKYADLRLDFADAAVIACAERNGGRILTLDRRDFDVVARGEGTITLVP